MPCASAGSACRRQTSPLSASASAYGRVTFESAIVLVRGTAPGILVTQ